MRPVVTLARTCAVAVLVVFCLGCGRKDPDVPGADAMVVSSHAAAEIEWSGDWDSAFEKARADHKAVLVTFYADWCIWCKRLEDTTLSDSQVAAYLSETVIPVRLDVEGDGRELSNRFEVDGLPTIMVFDSDGSELGRIPGYMPPDTFLERVRSFLS